MRNKSDLVSRRWSVGEILFFSFWSNVDSFVWKDNVNPRLVGALLELSCVAIFWLESLLNGNRHLSEKVSQDFVRFEFFVFFLLYLDFGRLVCLKL